MSYVIAGRQVPKYAISLGTFISVGLLAYTSTGGDKKKTGAHADAGRVDFPTSSGNSEESDFIKNFIAEAEKADSKH